MQGEQIDCYQSRAVVWDCTCGERHSFLEGFDNQLSNDIGCNCGRRYSIRWQPHGTPPTIMLIPRRDWNPIEQKHLTLNTWLRRHPSYQVILRFLSLYGCCEIEVLYEGERQHLSWGDTLEKRLDEVLKFLGIEEKKP